VRLEVVCSRRYLHSHVSAITPSINKRTMDSTVVQPVMMATKTPSTGSPITALPNELLHAVLVLLPARQLVKMRQVSKHLEAYVDENEQALLRDKIEHN